MIKLNKKLQQLSITLIFSVFIFLLPHQLIAREFADEFYRLAQSCKNENKIDKAVSYYKQVLRINPKHFEAAFNAANMLYNANHAEEALTFYKQALSINSHYAEIHYNLGLCFLRLEKVDEACAVFKEATILNPRYVKAYIQMATIYVNKKDNARALEIYQDAIVINPNSFELYYRMGAVLRSLEHHEQAVTTFEKALEMQPTSTHIMLELANTLHMIDDYERALEMYKKVLEYNPNCSEALYNFGYTLKKCGDTAKAQEHMELAIQVHTEVLKQRPDYPLAHFSRSLSRLTLGDFELGWPEYEWRWAAYNEKPKEFSQPIWNGQDLRGKRIFVYAEQGFGDTFQFVRYSKILKEMGAYVIVQTQHHLKDIISQCPHLDEAISDREPIPSFDYHIALMSIPMVTKTTLETVPRDIPYLGAKDELVEQWKNKLANDKKLKIGICWQGNKQYRSIYLKKEVASKAMQLSTLAPLASVPNISLYSLQKINGTEQLDEVRDIMEVHTFGPDFDEANGRFMDTAAIIKNLDLVITIDTSICHLAAGLGTEVWVLLPFPADWRWMLERDDTPWYPNMRLFRQKKRGNWECILEEVVTALKEKIVTSSQNDITTQKNKIETKKKPTSSLSDQHNFHNNIRTSAQKKLPTQLGAVIDNMTQRSVAMQYSSNPYHIRSLITDHKLLQERYQPYMEQSEELKNLTQQLLALNKRLWQLDKKLPEDRPTFFDESFAALIQDAYKVHIFKEMTMQQINEIANQLKEKSEK